MQPIKRLHRKNTLDVSHKMTLCLREMTYKQIKEYHM